MAQVAEWRYLVPTIWAWIWWAPSFFSLSINQYCVLNQVPRGVVALTDFTDIDLETKQGLISTELEKNCIIKPDKFFGSTEKVPFLGAPGRFDFSHRVLLSVPDLKGATRHGKGVSFFLVVVVSNLFQPQFHKNWKQGPFLSSLTLSLSLSHTHTPTSTWTHTYTHPCTH